MERWGLWAKGRGLGLNMQNACLGEFGQENPSWGEGCPYAHSQVRE